MMVEKKVDPKPKTKSGYSFEAFMIVAQEYNPFRQPQKPTDGGKTKRKKKKGAQ